MTKFIAITLCVTLLSGSITCLSQSSKRSIVVDVQVNGKVIDSDKLRLLIRNNGKKIEKRLSKGRLLIEDADLKTVTNDKFDLRLFIGRFALEFIDLTEGHFRGNWKFVVSEPEFIELDGVGDPDLIDYVYRIEFNVPGGLGTVWSRTVYKDK